MSPVVLYDNLRSAVLERRDDAIRFHPALLAFAAHYRCEPRPVAVARGNEKGRVEHAIRVAHDSFFAARQFRDLDDLNRQAEDWYLGIAADADALRPYRGVRRPVSPRRPAAGRSAGGTDER
jgi:transposase